MRVADGREAARRWVEEEASSLPGFAGAFSHGSLNWLPESADLPATSDVDLILLLERSDPPEKIGKLLYEGILLDASFLPIERFDSTERVLADYRLAGSFARASIFADPSERLTALRAAVAERFTQRRWIQARCEDAEANIARHLGRFDDSESLHERAVSWLFGAGVTTHVLLVAGLRNPTVRRRYAAARELLAECGLSGSYPELLALLGCTRLEREKVERHLEAMSEAFDVAKKLVRSPFPFAADISDHGRIVAVEGSRRLVESGLHREAVFWIAVTLSRCQEIFARDASAAVRRRFQPPYLRLLDDLGGGTPEDLRERVAGVRAYLPRLRSLAAAVMGADGRHDGGGEPG